VQFGQKAVTDLDRSRLPMGDDGASLSGSSHGSVRGPRPNDMVMVIANAQYDQISHSLLPLRQEAQGQQSVRVCVVGQTGRASRLWLTRVDATNYRGGGTTSAFQLVWFIEFQFQEVFSHVILVKQRLGPGAT
jgi:hypothetical protein